LIEDIVDTLSGCEESNTTPYWSILIAILLAVIALGIMGIANYFRFDFLIFRRRFSKNESKRTPHKWDDPPVFTVAWNPVGFKTKQIWMHIPN
jgi:hypothetical protein